MAFSFRGGVTLPGKKLSARAGMEVMPALDFVTLPLLQHKGEVCLPLVQVGQRVLKGQVIAKSADGKVYLHASVSGTVQSIAPAVTTLGEVDAIVIENDYKEEVHPDVRPFSTPIFQATGDQICDFIQKSGIVGMGGGAYPTAQKIRSVRGKIQRIIINCAESEPYLTSDHRILLEKAQEVVGGAKILMRATECDKAIFAIENNKENAIDAVQKVIGASENFALAVCRTKYPQGDERQLVSALLGKEIPADGKSADMEVAIFNVETCWAIYRAFVTGMPVVDRVVTVSGDCVKHPSNLLVPLGTAFRDVFSRCGGFVTPPQKILSGGPMMGDAIPDEACPVTKCVGAALALKPWEKMEAECIRCGRCHRVCPMHLMPMELVAAVKGKKERKMLSYSITSCSECGACSYICPSRIPILASIRQGKEILSRKNKTE